MMLERIAKTVAGPAATAALRPAVTARWQVLMRGMLPRADAGSLQFAQDRLVPGGRWVVRERVAESVVERQAGGDRRGCVRGDDLGRAWRPVGQADSLELLQRDELVAPLDLVCGR